MIIISSALLSSFPSFTIKRNLYVPSAFAVNFGLFVFGLDKDAPLDEGLDIIDHLGYNPPPSESEPVPCSSVSSLIFTFLSGPAFAIGLLFTVADCAVYATVSDWESTCLSLTFRLNWYIPSMSGVNFGFGAEILERATVLPDGFDTIDHVKVNCSLSGSKPFPSSIVSCPVLIFLS